MRLFAYLCLAVFVFCGCVNMIIPFLTLKKIKDKEADTSLKRFSSRVCGKSENEITENLNSCSLSHNSILLCTVALQFCISCAKRSWVLKLQVFPSSCPFSPSKKVWTFICWLKSFFPLSCVVFFKILLNVLLQSCRL